MHFRCTYQWVGKDSRIRANTLLVEAKDKTDAEAKAKAKLATDYGNKWYKLTNVIEA